MAIRDHLHLRTAADNPLEESRLPAAGTGLGGAGQGDRCLHQGIQAAVHLGDFGVGTDGVADGQTVRGSVPVRGRVPRSEAAVGLGGVPGVDRPTSSYLVS